MLTTPRLWRRLGTTATSTRSATLRGIATNDVGWLLLGFAVAAAYLPIPAEAIVPRWAVIAVGIPLVSWVDPRVLPGAILGVLAWIVGLGATSLIVSPDRLAGALELFYILIMCGAFIAAAGLERIDGVMTGLGLGLIPSSVLAIAQEAGYRPVAQAGPWPPGLFYNSELLAEFAAVLFVWAVLRRKWWMVATAAVPLVLCHSRISVLVVVVALICVWRSRVKWLGLCAVVAAAPAAILMLGVDKLLSAAERVVIWLAMAEAVTPLGRGLGWVSVALPRQQFVHSDALQAFVELGFGAAALAVIPIMAFWSTRGGIAERAAFIAVCIEAVVSFPLRVPATGFVAAVLAGWLVGFGPVVRLGEHYGGGDDQGCHHGERRRPYGDHGPSGWRGRALPV